MRIVPTCFWAVVLALPAIAQVPMITTVVGDGSYGYSGDGGPATLAQIGYPWHVAVDAAGNLYFNEWPNWPNPDAPIRRVDKATGTITAVVGGGSIPYPNDGERAADIVLHGAGGIAFDALGNLYFTDRDPAASGYLIRRVDAVTGRVTTIAGGGAPTIVSVPTGYPLFLEQYVDEELWSGDGGPATAAFLRDVNDITIDAHGNLYFVDFCVVRRIDATTGVVTRVAGDAQVHNEYLDAPFTGYILGGVHSGDGGTATDTGFAQLDGLAIDAAGNLHLSESTAFGEGLLGHVVRRIDAVTGIVSTVAGTGVTGYSGDGGPATSATLNWPAGLAFDAAGNLFIAEYANSVVRRVDAVTAMITTVAGTGVYGHAGDGGPASAAWLGGPDGLAFDAEGNLFLCDLDNSRIRKVTGLNPNAPPTADAGPDQSIHTSGSVILQGSGSFDDNTATADLDFAWSLVQRPAGSVAVLIGANTAQASLVVDVTGTYVVELLVVDSGGLTSGVDTIVIASTNVAPTANAGPDQGGVVSHLVTLDGSASTDPELDPLLFSWAFTQVPAGSAAALSSTSTANPHFTPDVAGAYVVALVVDDGFGPSWIDQMVVTVITGQQFAEITTVEAMNATAALPTASVTSSGNQQAIVQFLSQAVLAVQGANLAEARLKLQMAISRTDGYPLRGAVDKNGPGRDWVTDPATQTVLYQQLVTALAALAP